MHKERFRRTPLVSYELSGPAGEPVRTVALHIVDHPVLERHLRAQVGLPVVPAGRHVPEPPAVVLVSVQVLAAEPGLVPVGLQDSGESFVLQAALPEEPRAAAWFVVAVVDEARVVGVLAAEDRSPGGTAERGGREGVREAGPLGYPRRVERRALKGGPVEVVDEDDYNVRPSGRCRIHRGRGFGFCGPSDLSLSPASDRQDEKQAQYQGRRQPARRRGSVNAWNPLQDRPSLPRGGRVRCGVTPWLTPRRSRVRCWPRGGTRSPSRHRPDP